MDRKQIVIQPVTLRLQQQPAVSGVIAWPNVAALRESFVQAFPEIQGELQKYFTDPTRKYFSIYHTGPAGGNRRWRNFNLQRE